MVLLIFVTLILLIFYFSHNPNFKDREGVELEEIPFVQDILAVKYGLLFSVYLSFKRDFS